MRWVTANDLENWARSLSSQDELPKVISDLIRASAEDIATMRFPSGDKGQVRGFDGHLVCDTAGFNVPLDRSYWEFGTNRDYKVKLKFRRASFSECSIASFPRSIRAPRRRTQ